MLGQLWMEGYFGVGDPLVRHGSPANRAGNWEILNERAVHLEIIVEEPSMEAFLNELLRSSVSRPLVRYTRVSGKKELARQLARLA